MTAFGENPKSVYGKEGKRPKTRMATAAILREAFIEAKEYLQKCANPDPEKRPPRSLKLEALGMVLRRELPLKMHAHRADDILTAIRLAKEFNLLATIEHCTEGYRIADEVRAAGFGVILGPLISERSKAELKEPHDGGPTILHRAGVIRAGDRSRRRPGAVSERAGGACASRGLPRKSRFARSRSRGGDDRPSGPRGVASPNKMRMSCCQRPSARGAHGGLRWSSRTEIRI